MNIIKVDASNIEKDGFFCRMSKSETQGNQNKMKWLKERFKEGLTMQLLDIKEGGRGYIEYIPGKYAFRAINAENYLVIHCLWVVGKSQKQGFAKKLVEQCIEDAKKQKLDGIAILTSEKTWLIKKSFFEHLGFKSVTKTEDKIFNIMTLKFDDKAKDPSFCKDYEKKAKVGNKGFTVFYTHQCPYIDDAVEIVKKFAQKKNIPFQTILLNTAEEVRTKSPSPYGTFGIIYKDKLISYTYLLEKDLEKLITEIG
ncbi:MAG TPA: GNAT family N-acetyltransferase [Candidatus Dojkabacteria bacterium]|nr:GNAT family N-acetyltransferase [Candidatus Dojkabacteria bacterium]HQF36335.1 GNAT family N-acetyltransferase [Candidatus Dojkabacteria bacterium]